MFPALKNWSYSTYSTWKQCALKIKFQKIDKLPSPPSEAMARGSAIHLEAEQYVGRQIGTMPKSLEKFGREFRALRASTRSQTELEVAFDHSDDLREPWQLVDWAAGNARFRAKLDLFALRGRSEKQARVIDYKTGKIYGDHDLQLELYALVAFRLVPELQEVQTELWYLDSGEMATSTYLASHGHDLAESWSARVKPMLADMTYNPSPSGLCRFCPYSKAKGGPCKFY